MAYLLSGRAMVSFFLCPVVWRGRPVRLPEYHERKQLFWADETTVSPRGIFCFILEKLLFLADETLVSARRNFCFLLVELLFSLSGTLVFTRWIFCFYRMKRLFSPDVAA